MKGATLKDVARTADVSIASASRAINGLHNVADDVRRRVLEAAARLRYVPHGGARSLVMSRTNTVGVLLPDIYGEFFSEIIRGVDIAARARGLHLLVSGSHRDLEEALSIVRAMSGRVDGLLVMSPFVDSLDLGAVLPVSLPLVTIASRVGRIGQSSISIDNFGGGVTAVAHLIEQGCRRVAHISGPSSNFEAQERRRGLLTAVAQALPGYEPPIYEGDFNEESGYRGAKQFLSEAAGRGGAMPDGIFAANDMMAVGCLLALREAGVRVPQDTALIGFDDIPLARFTSPPLSTLRVGVFDLGRRGLELLIRAIEREAHDVMEPGEGIVVTPELAFRESSRRAAASE